jgi:hypothetical protein
MSKNSYSFGSKLKPISILFLFNYLTKIQVFWEMKNKKVKNYTGRPYYIKFGWKRPK